VVVPNAKSPKGTGLAMAGTWGDGGVYIGASLTTSCSAMAETLITCNRREESSITISQATI
jgi:hypothetical protein